MSETSEKAKSERERVFGELERGVDRAALKKHPYTGYEYLETHTAIRTANDVFGFDGWDSIVVDGPRLAAPEWAKQGKNEMNRVAVVTCTVRVTARIDGRVSVHDGVGLCTAEAPVDSFAGSLDTAFKGAEADALKRALIKLGDRFGLTLYEKDKKLRNYDGEAAPASGGSTPATTTRPAFAPAPAPTTPDGWKASLQATRTKTAFSDAWTKMLAAWPEGKATLGVWASEFYDALPDEAPAPAASNGGGGAGGARPRTSSWSMKFGRDKGVALSDLDDRSIDWYLTAMEAGLADPDKANFRESNQKNLDALLAEKNWRAANNRAAA